MPQESIRCTAIFYIPASKRPEVLYATQQGSKDKPTVSIEFRGDEIDTVLPEGLAKLARAHPRERLLTVPLSITVPEGFVKSSKTNTRYDANGNPLNFVQHSWRQPYPDEATVGSEGEVEGVAAVSADEAAALGIEA